MGLTNAERQARWRERQKQKLAEAQAPSGDDVLERVAAEAHEAGVMSALTALHDAWKAGLRDWVDIKNSDRLRPDESAALEAALAENFGLEDMKALIRMTAFARTTEHWTAAMYGLEPAERKWIKHIDDVQSLKSKKSTA